MLTYLVTAIVSFAPGVLLGFAIPPGRDRWIAWAASPILTLGLIAVGLAWLPTLGLPDSAQWVFGVEVLLAAIAASGSWLIARRRRVVVAAGTPAMHSATAEALEPAAVSAGDIGQTGSLRPEDGTDVTGAPNSHSDPDGDQQPDSDAGAAGNRSRTWWRWLGFGSTGRPRLIDVITLAVPAVIAVGFGRLLLRPLAYPPGWDAMNHALLTRNILESGSTATSAVCTTGGTVPELACHFYPLGADVAWAQSAALSGGHISTAMLAWSEIVGPLALVFALYTAVRVFGGGAVVAGCAALVPVIVSPMFPSLLTGRPPEAFEPAMAVTVAVLAALAIRGRRPIQFGLLAGLGTAGLVMSHTYEVLFAATLALAFLFVPPIRIKARAASAAVGAIVLATVGAIGPIANVLLGAGGERLASKPPFVGHFALAWHYWVTSPADYAMFGPLPYAPGQPLDVVPTRIALLVTLACLVAAPLCLVFKQLRWARPWLYMWVVWTAVGLWTSTSDSGPSTALSGLWYNVSARLATLVLPVHGILAVAGAYAIGLSLHRVVTTVVRRGRNLRLATVSAATVAALFAVGVVGLGVTTNARATLSADFKMRTPNGAAYPRVYAWLAQHTSPGKVVAYDRHIQFMTWSYADDGVAPLFGIPPLVLANLPNYDDRWQAWDWLVNNPHSTPSGCLVRKFGIQYVAVGSQDMPRYKLNYRQTRLAASPNVTLVHTDGGIKVYQVNDAGSACASSR